MMVGSTLFLVGDAKSDDDNDSMPSLVRRDDLESEVLLLLSFFELLSPFVLSALSNLVLVVFFSVESLSVVLLLLLA